MSVKRMLAAVLACAAMAGADQIKLSDGSVLNGQITLVKDGKITVKTAFAGELKIDASKVTSMTTDAPVNVATAGGKVSGKLTETGVEGTAYTLKDVTAAWPQGAEDPTLPKPPAGRKWSYEVSGEITGKTGNTEKSGLGLGAKATLTGPQDKLMFYLRGKYARENHVTNEKSALGGLDYEQRISGSQNAWYTRGEYKYDKYSDLNPEITGAAGYGYYFVDKDNFKNRLRIGLSYVYRDYESDRDSDSSFGIDTNYHQEWKIDKCLGFEKLGTLVTDVTYTPVFEDWENYHLVHESALSVPLGGSKFWSIRLGMNNDYYGQVAEGTKHLDTTYFLKLVCTWE